MLQVFCSTKRRPRIWMRMSLETCAMLQAIQFWDCILTCLGSALGQGVTRDLVEERRFILPSQATATPVSRKRPCRSGQWHPGSKSCRNPRTKQRPRQNIRYLFLTGGHMLLAMQSECKVLKPHLPVLFYTLEYGQPFLSPQRWKSEGCYRLTNTGLLLAALVTSGALGGFERDCTRSKTRKPRTPWRSGAFMMASIMRKAASSSKPSFKKTAANWFLSSTERNTLFQSTSSNCKCQTAAKASYACNGLQTYPVEKTFPECWFHIHICSFCVCKFLHAHLNLSGQATCPGRIQLLACALLKHAALAEGLHDDRQQGCAWQQLNRREI